MHTNVYQLKVTLKEIQPPIWRCLQVPADMSLDRLHRVVQDAMGWTDTHLHAYEINGIRYGVPDMDTPEDERDERDIRLDGIAGEGERILYEYDFGDGWEHEIVVEKIQPPDPDAHYPRCVGGERACPPEDCGGPPGYQELLEILRDPSHPEYEDTRHWLDRDFNPEALDLDDINAALKRLR